MSFTAASVVVSLCLSLSVFSSARAESGRLYGKVVTEQDEVYQGFIR